MERAIRLTCRPGPCTHDRSQLVIFLDLTGSPPCSVWGLEAPVRQQRRVLMSARPRRRIQIGLAPQEERVGALDAVLDR